MNDTPREDTQAMLEVTLADEAVNYAHAPAQDVVADIEQKIADAYRCGFHDGRDSTTTHPF